MKKYKMSIIVTIYNLEKQLERCLTSLQNQTLEDIEVLCINDGSTDRSQEIIDQFVKKDPQKFKSYIKENGGGDWGARTYGINRVESDYFIFVDGDDYIMQDYVEYLLKLAIENNTDISLTTEMFGNFQTKQVKNDKIAIWTGEQATIGILCYKIPIGVYSKIFKRSFTNGYRFSFRKKFKNICRFSETNGGLLFTSSASTYAANIIYCGRTAKKCRTGEAILSKNTASTCGITQYN